MPIEFQSPSGDPHSGAGSSRPVAQSLFRGFVRRCPKCGTGRMFRSYLKTVDVCSNCGEELHHHRADDAPPYFTIMIVGHLIIPLVLSIEMAYQPPMTLQFAFWLPVALILSAVTLGPVKGALVGLHGAVRMHGFGPDGEHDGQYS